MPPKKEGPSKKNEAKKKERTIEVNTMFSCNGLSSNNLLMLETGQSTHFLDKCIFSELVDD